MLPPNNNYTVFIFDIDNTIINYQRTESEALINTYTRYFKEHTSMEEMIDEFKRINRNLWISYRDYTIPLRYLRINRFQQLIDIYHLKVSPNSIAAYYESLLKISVYPYNDAIQFIKTAYKNYELCIISNGISEIQYQKLHTSKIKSYFTKIIISEDVGFQKPSPEIFKLALDFYSIPPEDALVFGDSLNSDLLGAKNSRIDFCWVNRNNIPLNNDYPNPTFTISNFSEISL